MKIRFQLLIIAMWFQGIMAVEMPQNNAQRRSAVIMQHILPQMNTVHVPQVLHNVCSAQTAIDLTNLPQPSQTASYLAKIPKSVLEIKLALGTDMKYQGALAKHASLIAQCAAQEHALHKTHYAFYHGLSKEVLFGLLLNTELGRIFDKHNADEWYKLRRTEDFYREGLSLGDYLRKNTGKITDLKSPYRDNLLSVNLSFPGHYQEGESSFHYFCANRSIADTARVKMFFANFISQYIPDCYANLTDCISTITEKLVQKLNAMSNTGSLLQIFIPKDMVDECAFLCAPSGTYPSHEGFLHVDVAYSFADTSLGVIDNISQYYTKISPFLENYQNGCTKLDQSELFKMQARLRLDSDKFNNPQSGIKMFLHHEFTEQEFIDLKNEIRMLVQNFIAHKDIQFLLSLYQECYDNPHDNSALEDAIVASEAAYKICKKTLALVDPLQPLSEYFTVHKHTFHSQEISLLQTLVAQYPRLGFAKSKVSHMYSCRNANLVEKCVISPDSSKMILLYKDGQASLFDLTTFQNVYIFDKNCNFFTSAQFSIDSSKAFFIDKNSVECIDLTKKNLNSFVYKDYIYVNGIYSPDGKKVVTTSVDGTVYIWDVASQKNIATLINNKEVFHQSFQMIKSLVFSPDGTKIATFSLGGTVSVWDISTGKRIFFVEGNNSDYCGIAFSPDSTKLIFMSKYCNISLCDLVTGKILATFLCGGAVSGIAFSPDGTKIFTTSEGGYIYTWDMVTHKLISQSFYQSRLLKFAVSKDGKRIGVGAEDGTVFVLDASTGRQIAKFKHDKKIDLIEFSPDVTKLFTASADGMMSVWDVKEDTLATWLQQKTVPVASKVQEDPVEVPDVHAYMESLL